MAEFKTIVADLKVKTVRFMPGEHDASLDRGAAFKEFFGDTSYTFDHKGVHFIAIDNVSDPGAKIGDVVLIAGKGHEDYQEANGVRAHFSDVEVAAAALGGRSAG